eukprot:16435686-Heterocapsa_arctica.AAC.1
MAGAPSARYCGVGQTDREAPSGPTVQFGSPAGPDGASSQWLAEAAVGLARAAESSSAALFKGIAGGPAPAPSIETERLHGSAMPGSGSCCPGVRAPS